LSKREKVFWDHWNKRRHEMKQALEEQGIEMPKAPEGYWVNMNMDTCFVNKWPYKPDPENYAGEVEEYDCVVSFVYRHREFPELDVKPGWYLDRGSGDIFVGETLTAEVLVRWIAMSRLRAV